MRANRSPDKDLSGLIIVDKPTGMTSHDVVDKVRRILSMRKVGHAGTLDPMATGVLVLGVGKATKLLGQLALTTKAYAATIRLGQATTTDDAQGTITATNNAEKLTEAEVSTAMQAFRGEISQVPSTVSAIKVDGRRAYARVRAGEQVELPPRLVTITTFKLQAIRQTLPETVDVDVFVECSSGTYVRALARDLGSTLDVGGHLTALRRTQVGPFTLATAHTLDQLTELVHAGHSPFFENS